MNTVKEILIRLSQGWEITDINELDGMITIYNPNELDDLYDQELIYDVNQSEIEYILNTLD